MKTKKGAFVETCSSETDNFFPLMKPFYLKQAIYLTCLFFVISFSLNFNI